MGDPIVWTCGGVAGVRMVGRRIRLEIDCLRRRAKRRVGLETCAATAGGAGGAFEVLPFSECVGARGGFVVGRPRVKPPNVQIGRVFTVDRFVASWILNLIARP